MPAGTKRTCTYTKHKTQKRKVFQDGYVVQRGSAVILYDEISDRQVDSAEMTLTPGVEDYEFEKFLVECVDWEDMTPPAVKQKQPAARPATRRPFNAAQPMRTVRSVNAEPASGARGAYPQPRQQDQQGQHQRQPQSQQQNQEGKWPHQQQQPRQQARQQAPAGKQRTWADTSSTRDRPAPSRPACGHGNRMQPVHVKSDRAHGGGGGGGSTSEMEFSPPPEGGRDGERFPP